MYLKSDEIKNIYLLFYLDFSTPTSADIVEETTLFKLKVGSTSPETENPFWMHLLSDKERKATEKTKPIILFV